MTFRPGVSGSPAGRPPGTGRIAQLRQQIGEHVPEILAALVEQAKRGDVQASRLLLERVLPPVKPTETPQPVQLPDGASLSDTGRAILRNIADGQLGVRDGAALVAALAGLVRVTELEEIEARLSQLEEQQPQGAPWPQS